MAVSLAEAMDKAIKDAKESGAWDKYKPKLSEEFLRMIDQRYEEAFGKDAQPKKKNDK